MNEQDITPAAQKILAVDDNRVILNVLTVMLRSSGYKPLTAISGSEAFAIIHKEKPDLILLDLAFPPDEADLASPMQDGFFIIQWLHRTEETKNIPIIIISGTDPAKYRERAMAAGAKACLQKPLRKEDVLPAIEKVLGGKPS